MKRFLPLCLVAALGVWVSNVDAGGWVAVGLPLDNDNLSDAEAVGQDIPYCTDVSKWDAAGQGWVQHTVGLPPNNFACSVTMALMVYITQDGVWTLTGGVIDSTAYTFSLVGGWNFITVPLNKVALTTAELLGLDIPNCTDVSEWDASGQGWVQHTVGFPPHNFDVRVGYPYMVFCSAPGTWGGGTAAAASPGEESGQARSRRGARLAPVSGN